MAQHQQLGVLGQVRADQHRQQAEQAPHQPVKQRQYNPEMVPLTLPIPQQNSSSHHETEFPSGTTGLPEELLPCSSWARGTPSAQGLALGAPDPIDEDRPGHERQRAVGGDSQHG